MTSSVLVVGNCDADHLGIRAVLQQHFDVDVQRAHGLHDTLQTLRERRFDLVLINRVMDRDGGNGLEIMRAIQDDPHIARQDTPLMLVSDYEDAQAAALSAGAAPGFGKAQLRSNAPVERLRPFLAGPLTTE